MGHEGVTTNSGQLKGETARFISRRCVELGLNDIAARQVLNNRVIKAFQLKFHI